MEYGHIMSKNMIKILNIYSTSFWKLIQKLFQSKGEGYLLIGKMLVLVVMIVFSQQVSEAQVKGVGKIQSIESKRNLRNLEQAIVEIPKPGIQERLKKNNPDIDIVRFPVIEYQVDTTQLGFVTIGESIPDEILDMPLNIINHEEGKTKSTLRELANKKFLVLDFWAKWCKPCILSMNKWESIKPEIEQDIHVVGVHLDYDYKAQSEVDIRHWTSIQIVGKEGYILNRYLCRYYVVGPCAWIKDGKLFGVANSAPDGYHVQLMNGDINVIPEAEIWRPY